jgi:NADH-quinone oxidoreductase subunit A
MEIILNQNFLKYFSHTESLFKHEYFGIFIYFCISIILVITIISLSYSLINQKPDLEKLSSYECGFEPYEDTRHKFDVKFYIVAILFIIFDIEIMFLFPWCMTLSQLNLLGFWSMIEFIFELGIAFIYVWIMKSLEWN